MFKEQGFDNNWLLPTGEQDAQMRQCCGQKRFETAAWLSIAAAVTYQILLIALIYQAGPGSLMAHDK